MVVGLANRVIDLAIGTTAHQLTEDIPIHRVDVRYRALMRIRRNF
jgi:hypothetical protein